VPHRTLAEGLDQAEAGKAFGLLVSASGIKDTASGSITLLTGVDARAVR
jgi:hypothetical protein